MSDLEEVKTMLAERVKEWTREWKQEGFEEGLAKGRAEGRAEGLEKGRKKGREEGLAKAHEKARAALVRQLERRFGPLPQEARQRIEALDLEAIVDLSAAVATAPSLAALELS